MKPEVGPKSKESNVDSGFLTDVYLFWIHKKLPAGSLNSNHENKWMDVWWFPMEMVISNQPFSI